MQTNHANRITISKYLLGIVVFIVCFTPFISTATTLVPDAKLIEQTIGGFIHNVVVSVGGLLLGFAGQLFNYSIQILVVEMGQLINSNTNIGHTINELWKVIRDLLNIGFIFGLIYIGIKTILNSEDSGTRRTLGMLLAAALLVNFSLFITKVIIDFTNAIAVQIYFLFGNISGTYTHYSGSGVIEFTEISGAFVSAMGLISLIASSQTLDVATSFTTFGYTILAVIFLIIAGITFLGGAFMLLTRFVVLILCMTTSPLMFLGWVVPSLDNYAKRWWNTFLQQAFFAPVYLFLIYLSLQFLLGYVGGVIGTAGDLSESLRDSPGRTAFQVAIGYGLGIGLLIASQVVAKQTGVIGASATLNTTNALRRNTQSFAGRNTVGRLSPAAGFLATAVGGKRYGESVKNRVSNAKFGGSYSRADDKEWNKKRSITVAGDKKQKTLKEVIEAGRSKKASSQAKIAMADALDKASPATLIDLSKKDPSLTASVANHISASKFEKILESDELSPGAKKTLSSGLSKATLQSLQYNKENPKKPLPLESVLGNATTNEIDALDFEKQILPNAWRLQSGQLDELKKKWNTEKYRVLDDAHEKQLLSADMDNLAIINSRKNKKEIAQLPKQLLSRPLFIQKLNDQGFLDGDLLGHIARESKVDKRQFGANMLQVLNADNDIRNLEPGLQRFLTNGAGTQFLPDGVQGV